ncbi:MAG: PDZ domain-containing protein [Limnochordia bacterium]|jgi:hypothetical protein
MTEFLEVTKMLLRAVPQMLQRPDYLIIASLVIFLVNYQYKRMAKLEARLFGAPRNHPGRQTLYAIFFGLLGGLIGTFVFIFVGISLTDTGIIYIWPLAVLLMLIHPRFLCFSYAGGLLALSSLFFGWPGIDIPSVMALVAVLHGVEAILIRISGHLQPTPVYVKSKEGGVIGGFVLQKFWPLPVIALVYLTLPGAPWPDAVNMPDWWPLIQSMPEIPPGYEIVYVFFPVVAALGYGDLAISSHPREKTKRAASHLLVYSGILLLLAVLAVRRPLFQYVAPLFAIIGHDLVIQLGQRAEWGGEPLHVAPSQGLLVLDILPEKTAHRLGLRTGDLVLAINGQLPMLGDDGRWLEAGPVEVLIRREERERILSCPFHPGGPLGIIPAPLPWTRGYVEMKGLEHQGWLVRQIRKLFRR